MMTRVINPYYKPDLECNSFLIRKKDYERLETDARKILEVAEEAGFEIKEFGIKESKSVASELAYTLKHLFIIRLEKNGKLIDLSMAIPQLINDNYIFINGKRKVPLFQLFDIPLIYRKMIKIRTSISSISIRENDNSPYMHMFFMGKSFNLADIVFAYYTKQEIEEIFKEELEFSFPAGRPYKWSLDLTANMNRGLTQEEYVKIVGKPFSESFQKSKGETAIYALKILLKCDIMSARLLGSTDVVLEIGKAIRSKRLDDTDLINKRIRCFEYIVTSRIAKVIYDLCVTNLRMTKPKFNVNSAQIVNNCNVSDIVQFDFAINPIEELTKLSRCTLVGPGGFNKENVPAYLRDISESMFGRICPVDTPDRENCGVQQSLLVNSKLDENFKFTKERIIESPTSVAISMIPFLEHDDQTRLQMAASQMRQAIMLQKFDEPYVQSGCEHLYSRYTSFCCVAEHDGDVLFCNGKILIVQYSTNKEVKVFWIGPRNTYTDNIDIMRVYVKIGDSFKKGDILAESQYMKNGATRFGKNLLTAFITYYGFNYEDGIVISERLVKEGVFTSVHYNDMSFMIPPDKVLLSLNKYGEPLKFLPDLYESIKIGHPYAKMKDLSSMEGYKIFEDVSELIVHKTTTVFERSLYVNGYFTDIPEYREWVEEEVAKQKDEEVKLQNFFIDLLGKKEAFKIIKSYNLNKFTTSKYKIKGEEFPGIYVEMAGYYLRPIRVGDKVGNRHGNKGVISRIIPEERMPYLPDGRRVDIIMNPMGVISRMNIGQLFELHLSMSLHDLKKTMLDLLSNGETQENMKKYLLDYIKIIDQTDDRWYYKQMVEIIDPIIVDKQFILDLTIIQAPFKSCNEEALKEALKYTNTEYSFPTFDPVGNIHFQNEIAVGYNYFFKMIHIAEEKISARGIGLYNRRTLQPLSGKKSKGGQRLGEMENQAIIAMEGEKNLDEFATTKSDCIDRKNKHINEIITSEKLSYLTKEEDFCEKAESVKLMDAYFTQIGVRRSNVGKR